VRLHIEQARQRNEDGRIGVALAFRQRCRRADLRAALPVDADVRAARTVLENGVRAMDDDVVHAFDPAPLLRLPCSRRFGARSAPCGLAPRSTLAPLADRGPSP